MSTGAIIPDGIETQSQRAVSVNQDARQLVNALTGLKRTRFILLLAIVLFTCVACYSFYRLLARFQEKEHLDLLLRTAQARLVQRDDLVMQDVQALLDHSTPVISKALSEQFKKDLPGFLQAVQAERDTLVDDLKVKLIEHLKQHHEELLSRHDRLLREEFPEIKDEKLHVAMMANLNVAVDLLVQKYYIAELQSETTSLYSMWDEFPAAPAAEKGDLPLEDQLVANLLELLKIKLAETATSEAGTDSHVPASPDAVKPELPEVPADAPADAQALIQKDSSAGAP